MSVLGAICAWCILYLNLSASAAAAAKGARGKWPLNKIWNHVHEVGHMQELLEPVHKPGQNNSVAICATMKDENATDVREWLLYYRCFPHSGCILRYIVLVYRDVYHDWPGVGCGLRNRAAVLHGVAQLRLLPVRTEARGCEWTAVNKS